MPERSALTPRAEQAKASSSVDVASKRYKLQRARYEKTAALVAETISSALRKESIRHLLSFRAKHPDEFAEKLVRKRGNAKYERLGEDLNEVVTDLAGVRVIVYDPRDEPKVAAVVRKVLKLAAGEAADTFQVFKGNGERRYRATHLLVMAPDGSEHMSVHGARCEVQICNVAAHLFNEVEHDITYKRKNASPTKKTLKALEELEKGCRQLEEAAEETFKRHERDMSDQTTDLLDAEDLRSGLEKAAGKTLHGDFRTLFAFLSPVMQPLTVRGIEGGATVETLIERGRKRRHSNNEPAVDEAVALALELATVYGPEFRALASEWDGSPSPVVDAILQQVGCEGSRT